MSKRIDVKDLNVYYSKFLAVEGVNINIDAKSVTAFIGPSGCGKSTFLRTLIRMVFQRPNPFPTMSIRDNVLAGVKLNNTKISKGEADVLVERSLQGANLWNEVKDRLA